LISALDEFVSFIDPGRENFSYSPDAGYDLENFANEKNVVYIGFYEDKKEILKINPRLDYEIDFFPLNTFPPKAKIYTKIYYLAVLKSKESLANSFFLNWFSKNKLKDFSNTFDLIPFQDLPDLDPSKKIIINSFNVGSETFDFLNKEIIFEKFDQILNLWQNSRSKGIKVIDQMIYSL